MVSERPGHTHFRITFLKSAVYKLITTECRVTISNEQKS